MRWSSRWNSPAFSTWRRAAALERPGFGLALGSDELSRVVNEWVVYADNAGLIDQAHRYWVKGQGAQIKKPRWSILRNVLQSGEKSPD